MKKTKKKPHRMIAAHAVPARKETPPVLAPVDVTDAEAPLPKFRRTAVEMATKQREISVSEFFAKNRHLLGFSNPTKAMLTAVKEAVDNSLDACEEAGVLPEVKVEVKQVAEDRFRIAVEDNGPGIVRAQIPKIFGKLLYGSKFHRLKMSRGQQGIGISAAGLYGQITTGKPMQIISRIGPKRPAHYFEIHIDTAKNNPEVLKDEERPWEKEHGTRVEIEMEGRYSKAGHSIEDYLKQTVIANPHVRVMYQPPGEPAEMYERASDVLPAEPREIKPHPYGVELGVLVKMLKETKSHWVKGFLTSEFCRVSPRIAEEICQRALIKPEMRVRRVSREEVDRIFRAVQETKIMAPPTDCIVPIGEEKLVAGLKNLIQADFYTATTRTPSVYRGNPFLVEAALAYGGAMPADEPVELYRYANRVPLLYQKSACAITESVIEVDWRNYALQQPKKSVPIAPAVFIIHIASVWVPFTSESKEAVAAYPEIMKEIKLALMDCGRRLQGHIRHQRRQENELERRSIFEKYSGILAQSLHELTGTSASKLQEDLKRIAKKTTGLAEDAVVQGALAPVAPAPSNGNEGGGNGK